MWLVNTSYFFFIILAWLLLMKNYYLYIDFFMAYSKFFSWQFMLFFSSSFLYKTYFFFYRYKWILLPFTRYRKFWVVNRTFMFFFWQSPFFKIFFFQLITHKLVPAAESDENFASWKSRASHQQSTISQRPAYVCNYVKCPLRKTSCFSNVYNFRFTSVRRRFCF